MEGTIWSLLPPFAALLVAVISRRVVLALATGGLCGTLLMALGEDLSLPESLLVGTLDFVRLGVLGQPAEASKAQVLVLIALIGGFVHLLERSGAALALARQITTRVRSTLQAQLATWVGGLTLFFSDFGNVLILGPVFRPIYDRMGISREQLAWIIDSTAAPVCVMVPVISWGVYIIGLLEEGFTGLDPAAVEASLPGVWLAEAGTVDGFGTWLAALPFQLYPMLALLCVPTILVSGRHWGPMRRAAPVALPEDAAEDGPLPGASTALVPLLVLGAVMIATGAYLLQVEGRLSGMVVRVALGSAYLSAILACVGLLTRQGHGAGAFGLVREGMGRSMSLLILLVFAWTLGAVCREVGTGAFVASLVGDSVPTALLPLTVFAAGAVTSFATGTSWGTFAILLPIAIPMSVALGAPVAVSIGAVLSGGIFGDHCSPISDTTLLASMGAGTDHAAHVATQLPYALVTGGAAAVSFVVAGATGAAWSVGIGAVVIVGVGVATRAFGSTAAASAPGSESHRSAG